MSLHEFKLDDDTLRALQWTPLDVEITENEHDVPAMVSFDHPIFFMIINFGEHQGVAFSRDESVALLRLMMSRLPLDTLGEIRNE